MNIEVISNHKCTLGEGPLWDIEQQVICWIDIIQGQIHQYSFQNKHHQTYSIDEMIGCFALSKNNQFIIATQSGLGFLDRTTGKIELFADPESHLSNNRFNDGKCDPLGRFWAGTMSLSEESNAGSVYVFDDEKIEKKIENVTISNGMAWSLDHKTFYYIDTPTFEVVAYNYDLKTGEISNRKTVIEIPKEDGYPDGMTIDATGCLWIAHWDGWQLTRWNPETGQKIYAIKMPVSKVTSCTFGGKDLNDLFISSANVGLSAEELQQQPLAGSLFVIRNCGFVGVPTFEFKNK